MNSLTVAVRILQQLKHEKRTLALMLIAPIAMLTLVYFIFSDASPMISFDAVGAAFLGVIVYFFVFLVAGINLLDERTTGMLGRLLVTPIRRWELVTGYFTGFGTVAVVQSALLSLFYIYILDVTMQGSFLLALFIIMLAAFNALTLGMLLSSVANNQFQMVQFIPLVIIPQIIFCGLFPMTGVWDKVAHCMPLYYIARSLRNVVLYGKGFTAIWTDLAIVAGMAALFAVLNILVLKKHRAI
jgi:ABC-2 type transport system permease protein